MVNLVRSGLIDCLPYSVQRIERLTAALASSCDVDDDARIAVALTKLSEAAQAMEKLHSQTSKRLRVE
jgi:hypothetical protein